jgi:hypothetical protein
MISIEIDDVGFGRLIMETSQPLLLLYLFIVLARHLFVSSLIEQIFSRIASSWPGIGRGHSNV